MDSPVWKPQTDWVIRPTCPEIQSKTRREVVHTVGPHSTVTRNSEKTASLAVTRKPAVAMGNPQENPLPTRELLVSHGTPLELW